MNRTTKAAVIGLGAAAFAALLLGAVLLRQNVRNSLPRLAVVQPFSFTDQNGAPFTADKLSGRITVFNTFFSSCPGPCSMLSTVVAELDRKFSGSPRIQFVSVTVDPERDTPAVLNGYKAKYVKTDKSKWTLVTGPQEALNRLLGESFNLGTAENPELHSMRLIAVSGLDVRGYYLSTVPEDLRKLESDLQGLLGEPAEESAPLSSAAGRAG